MPLPAEGRSSRYSFESIDFHLFSSVFLTFLTYISNQIWILCSIYQKLIGSIKFTPKSFIHYLYWLLMLVYIIMALTLKLSNEVRFSVVLVAAGAQCNDI